MQTRDVLAFPTRNPYQTDKDVDELFEDTARIVIESQNASAAYIQRKLSVGYARAARILDELQQAGIVGSADGAKPRDVFYKKFEDYASARNGSGPKDRGVEEDFGQYVLPKVKLNSLDFEPKVWKIPFGRDDAGRNLNFDLEKIGHLLIIGNPQSKKMEFADTILCSQLLCCTPDQIRFVIIDQSNYLSIYRGIPHLLSPVISDSKKTVSAFYWTLGEVSRRFKLFNQAGLRSFSVYNEVPGVVQLPRIVVLARLCQEPDKEMQSSITTLTSMASAAGIHLILIYDFAGGRYIPSDIKANLSNILIFRTTSSSDSNLAGVKGAEKLTPDEAILKGGLVGDQTKIKWHRISESDVRKLIKEIEHSQPS